MSALSGSGGDNLWSPWRPIPAPKPLQDQQPTETGEGSGANAASSDRFMRRGTGWWISVAVDFFKRRLDGSHRGMGVMDGHRRR